jgi:hypothetical protein
MSIKGLLAFCFVVIPPVVFNYGCAPGWAFLVYPTLWSNYWANAVIWLSWGGRFAISEKCLPLSFYCTGSPSTVRDACAFEHGFVDAPTLLHYASVVHVLIFVLIVLRFVYLYSKEQERVESMKSKNSLA